MGIGVRLLDVRLRLRGMDIASISIRSFFAFLFPLFLFFSYLETTDVDFQFLGQLQENMTLTKNLATAVKKVCSVIDTGTSSHGTTKANAL